MNEDSTICIFKSPQILYSLRNTITFPLVPHQNKDSTMITKEENPSNLELVRKVIRKKGVNSSLKTSRKALSLLELLESRMAPAFNF
jgi:predicted O-methyltransferase YrrM